MLTRRRLEALSNGRVYHQFTQSQIQVQAQAQAATNLHVPPGPLDGQHRLPPPPYTPPIMQPRWQWRGAAAQQPLRMPTSMPIVPFQTHGYNSPMAAPSLPMPCQNHAAGVAVAGLEARPGPPPQRSARAASTDSVQARVRVQGQEYVTHPDSYMETAHKFRAGESTSRQSYPINPTEWPVRTAANHPALARAVDASAGQVPTLPRSERTTTNVVYVDLPSRSVFTRSVLTEKMCALADAE